MFYPYIDSQTIIQWILNTIDPRVWRHRYDECECCWEYFQGNLMFIISGGCPFHD